MNVQIECAGDHKFFVSHLKKSGVEDLIEFALNKIGIQEGSWRVRLNQKQRCSGKTAPFSVIRFQSWCIYLRVKPGNNDTCHNVSLLPPPGYDAESLFNQLRTVEESFNLNWKNQKR